MYKNKLFSSILLLAVLVLAPAASVFAGQAGSVEEQPRNEIGELGFAYDGMTESRLEAATETGDELQVVYKTGVEDLTLIYPEEDAIFQKYVFAPALPGGIDHLAAGVGLRNIGNGAINLQGVPPNSVVVSAFVFAGVILLGPAPPTLTITFQGTPVTANLIGTTLEPCWNLAGTFAAYRASVRSLMLPGINGTYTVAGIPSNLTDGRDPWLLPNVTLPMAEGASLVVLYSNAIIPWSSWVEMHNVVQMTFGNLQVQHFLTRPITNSGTNVLKHTRLGADGSAGNGLSHTASASNETTSIGPIGGPFVQIKGPGSTVNTNSDWTGYDAGPLNQLWDTNTGFLPANSIPVNATNYEVRYSILGGDCVVPVVHVLTAR